jgi:peptidoglycan/xylan/chitin deacetylase (PgdA/CDA1 family)
MLTISIVIPAYNEEKLLPQCLASLKAQDYGGKYELIVVNHASTDGTARVAQKYGARILICTDRSGSVGAICPRDVGAREAQGDIIIQADADTVYPVDWLTKIARVFESRPEVVGLSGRFIYKSPPSWARLEYFIRDRLNRATQKVFGRPIIISGATFAFRREAFFKIGGYQLKAYSPDQYNISTRLRRQGKVVYDSAITVQTSHRAVQKPFPVIIGDVAVHFGRFSGDFIKSNLGFGNGMPPEARPRRRRLALRTGVAVVLVSLLAFTLYGYIEPTSSAFGKVYIKGDTNQKVIALTFDDGPNEPYTTEVVNILDTYDIKGTFFMVGRNVELYPDIARRMVAEGHVLGNHSYTHDANHALTTEGREDIQKGEEAIRSVAGVSPHFYRPPHGKKSPWELYFVKQDNMVEVTWNISTPELDSSSASDMAQKIVSQAKPGGIVLMHDGYGTDHNIPRADKSLTVAALPIIIEGLQAQGYTFVTVADLLDMPAYN